MAHQTFIDKESGFCFGVVTAIKKAEEELAKGEPLYCLGDIVHNGREVERLANLGLVTIDHDTFKTLRNVKVLLRAHGEPPSTYQIAKDNNITIIDASCPVVLRLQSKIKKRFQEDGNCQIVIYGKKGHAEVIGLEGQTNGTAIVVEGENDIESIDFTKDISLFSQTTKPLDGFNRLIESIKDRQKGGNFDYFDTICRQVANRIPNIRRFAEENDVVFFVGGKKSSNGKVLFEHCREANPNTFFVSGPDEITETQLQQCEGKKIGICGATSTPLWLMVDVKNLIDSKLD
ncbi:MAG: 4-hydroxy-3-methylbut-2-enyl diphosphate reductase [Paludibacteraceae bacterium]|nr:4-hydroxy-3-methylbut-2-enyl diphosphate reductase [Paludibacteraceae bacterium]